MPKRSPCQLAAMLLGGLIPMLGGCSVWAADPPPPLLKPENSPAHAFEPRILKVGPRHPLKMPSDAAAQVRDNDTVEIDAGVYVDCAVWRASNLTLRAIGGPAILKDKTCQGKGIWIVDGDNVTVDGIHFQNAAVADKNGAGIRASSGSLSIRNAVFENNENGILAGRAPGKRMLIESSTFIGNGKCDPVCAHGIYVGQWESLEVRNSTFRNQRIGHHIKSRARRTIVVGSRVEDGAAGTASYLIDIPNGGDVLIERNDMQKGPASDNLGTAISIGSEGVRNPTSSIRVIDNKFRSDLEAPPAFVRNLTQTPAELFGNTLCGAVIALEGPGQVVAPRPCKGS